MEMRYQGHNFRDEWGRNLLVSEVVARIAASVGANSAWRDDAPCRCYDPGHSMIVGKLPDAVVSARQPLTPAAGVLLGTHHQFGEKSWLTASTQCPNT